MINRATAVSRVGYWAFAALSVGVAGYGYAYLYQAYDAFNPFHTKFVLDASAPVHFFSAATALLLAPLQLATHLRRRLPAVHRTAGLAYVLAVLAGGLSALAMASEVHGGPVAALGFSFLGVVWITVTLRGLAAALTRDIETHRRWMLRSAALTFAAVTLRLMLGGGVALLGLPFETVYVAASWLCWTINLVVCEAALRHDRGAAAGSRWASYRSAS